MIKTAPTGKLIKGHVLDVNQKQFDRALQAYDKFLYTAWNSKKCGGWGCWEIRRRPEFKTKVEFAQIPDGSGAIVRLEAVEYNWLHHVLDAAYLNYDAIRRLKEMDIWSNVKHPLHKLDNLEKLEEETQEKMRQKALDETAYEYKHYKSAFNDFMNLVRKGENPAQVLSNTEWVYK